MKNKKRAVFVLITLFCIAVLVGCGDHDTRRPAAAGSSTAIETEKEDADMISLKIQVGSSVYAAKLLDNASTRALIAQMPMTLDMNELNGNEKYYDMPNSLPTNAERVESIRAGDLMLYGSDCLVLFYEGFQTSYRYTRLGHIEDISGLVDALGSGSVQVAFRVENETIP